MSNVRNLAGKATGAFAIILVAVALLAAACGSSGSTGGSGGGSSSGGSSGGSTPTSGSITVTEKDFTITPSSITAKAGDTLSVQNSGTVSHNLVIANSSNQILAQTPLIQPGQSAQLPLPSTLAAGTYQAYCSVPGHRQQGMQGTLTIS
jgi:uncharacterized cupredoxin-like copper-binding protein